MSDQNIPAASDLPEANDTELPHPTKTWVLDAEGSPVVWTAPGGRVMIQRIEPGDLTPAQARTFALNILAAAAYAEGPTMTDQNAPKATNDDRMLARKWAEFIESGSATWTDRIYAAARVILDTVPAPVPPTLADMPYKERRECRLMQADVRGEETRPVIVNPFWEEGRTRVMWPGGFLEEADWDRVTPRPDLPSMEWPSDKKADTPDAVPENTLAVGSVWDDADALARACEESGRDQIIALDRAGDAYVWSEASEWWEVVSPLSMNAPFTIIHTGKKTDQ